jgi:L-threonylcarbamoyladenylate synthase
VSASIGTEILTAAALLHEGKLVAIPTETVYGLAANALNEAAVLDIFKAKKRPDFDPLIVHAANMESAFYWASEIPAKAKLLAEAFWPGPLTLVLPKKKEIPYVVTSGLETVGLRVPDHSITRQLLQTLPFPLAAPSANPFGYISPTTAQHVFENLQNEIDYILDGGACEHGLESTIIGFENGEPVIYRRGSLPKSQLEKVVGPIGEKINSSSNPKAPGQLAVHYAPRKELVLVNPDNLKIDEINPPFTLLNFGNILDEIIPKAQCVLSLSPEGNITEAARKLYGILREADGLENPLIISCFLPGGDMAEAINDRLQRAATNL